MKGETMETLTVAQNILQQLGGHKFSAMTGSKNFVGDDKFLTFRIGQNAAGWTHCKITLTVMDDYTMTFYKAGKYNIVKTKDIDGIYCDNLTEIFRNETGLETSL